MKREKISEAMGNISSRHIKEAAEFTMEEKPHKSKTSWVKWASLAACLCLVVGAAFRIAIGFVPNQATDVFREGTLIEITSESDLPAQYDGKLLAFNLECSQYEFYYKQDGAAENTEDWYSLLGAKYDADAEGRIVLHCMFGDTTVDDWKVSKVFTKKATEQINVNGVEVLIARNEPSLNYTYWYYAIFEYDNVVYDIRVESNDAEYVYEVLDTLIQAE